MVFIEPIASTTPQKGSGQKYHYSILRQLEQHSPQAVLPFYRRSALWGAALSWYGRNACHLPMSLYNKHWAPQASAGIPLIFLALYLIRNEASTRDAPETAISRLNKNYQSKPLLRYMHFPSSPEEAPHARGTSHCQQWRQTVDVWDDYISHHPMFSRDKKNHFVMKILC